MPHKSDRKPTPVALFNSRYLLIGIFNSIKEASRVTGVVRQSIIKAVYGDTISAKECYWRAIPNDVILDQDDMGTLTLFEFDKEAGNPDRRIYKGTRMRKRQNIIMQSEYNVK